jgi:carbonic anhydrase
MRSFVPRGLEVAWFWLRVEGSEDRERKKLRPMFDFEKLEVWNEAAAFADSGHTITRAFPSDERFDLMRRAAVSISSNIAEGNSRSSRADFAMLRGLKRSLEERASGPSTPSTLNQPRPSTLSPQPSSPALAYQNTTTACRVLRVRRCSALTVRRCSASTVRITFCSLNKKGQTMNTASKLTVFTTIASLSVAALVLAAEPPAASVPADAALAKLKEGNFRFATSEVSKGKPVAARRTETAQKQHPFAIIIACADSRTPPELVFDQNLGDLFVIRTAGNLVDDHALGSIEYGVTALGARLIVVLGHERCGAVKAALASEHAPGHIESLVRDIQPAIKAAKGKPGDQLDAAITENAHQVAAEIKAKAELGDVSKEVRIVSAVYDLDTGKVAWAKD